MVHPKRITKKITNCLTNLGSISPLVFIKRRKMSPVVSMRLLSNRHPFLSITKGTFMIEKDAIQEQIGLHFFLK
jgi:hypothetical protein